MGICIQRQSINCSIIEHSIYIYNTIFTQSSHYYDHPYDELIRINNKPTIYNSIELNNSIYDGMYRGRLFNHSISLLNVLISKAEYF